MTDDVCDMLDDDDLELLPEGAEPASEPVPAVPAPDPETEEDSEDG